MRFDAMKLNHLRYYIAAVETGSFVAAGERLHIAKTSIAHGVSSLETLLGTQLLIRKRSGGVIPTPEGERFSDACRNFLFEAEILVEEFQSNARGTQGQFVVGCHEAISWAIAPRVIKELKTLHPDLSIILKTIQLDEFLSPLMEGEVDLIMNFHYSGSPSGFGLKSSSKDYYSQVLCRPRPYVMMSSGHPLCKRKNKKLYLKDLESYPHNLIQEDSALSYMGQIYKKAGYMPMVEGTNSSGLGAQASVGSSDTVAIRFFRPSTNLSPIGDPLAFKEIDDKIELPQIIAVARKSSQGNISTKAKVFIEECQKKFDDGTFKANLFYD